MFNRNSGLIPDNLIQSALLEWTRPSVEASAWAKPMVPALLERGSVAYHDVKEPGEKHPADANNTSRDSCFLRALKYWNSAVADVAARQDRPFLHLDSLNAAAIWGLSRGFRGRAALAAKDFLLNELAGIASARQSIPLSLDNLWEMRTRATFAGLGLGFQPEFQKMASVFQIRLTKTMELPVMEKDKDHVPAPLVRAAFRTAEELFAMSDACFGQWPHKDVLK